MRLCKKLYSLIINLNWHLYSEGSDFFRREVAGVKYPYDGPAFGFEIKDCRLHLTDNTVKEIHSSHWDEPREVHVDHGDFIEPQSNEVRAAFLKFQYWEEKIYAAYQRLDYQDALKTELQIITDKLINYAIRILTRVAISYCILGTNDPPVDHPARYRRDTPYGLGWDPASGVCIADDAPADIQLQVEEFNDLLRQTYKEISEFEDSDKDEISVNPVVKRAIQIKNEIRKLVRAYYEELLMLYVEGIQIDDLKQTRSCLWPAIVSRGDQLVVLHTLTHPADSHFVQLANTLARFHAIAETIGDTVNVLKTVDEYIQCAMDVASCLRQIVEDYFPQDVPQMTYSDGRISYSGRPFRSPFRVIKSIETVNLYIDEIKFIQHEQKTDKLIDAWLGTGRTLPIADPVAHTQSQEPTSESIAPTSQTDAVNLEGITTQSPRSNRKRTRDKSEPDIHREKIIRQAIKDGLMGVGYCSFLDANHVEPRKSWKGDPLWPGSYVKSYKSPVWRRRIQDEKSKINRLLNSPTRKSE